MFKQMLISSSSKPVSKRKSFIYNESFKSKDDQKSINSRSLDKLNRTIDSLDTNECMAYSAQNRCKSAKTYNEIRRELDLNRFLERKTNVLKGGDLAASIRDRNLDLNNNEQEIIVSNDKRDDRANDQPNDQEQLNKLLQIDNLNVTRRLRVLTSRFRERTAEVRRKLEKQLSSYEEEADGLSEREDAIPSYNHDWFRADELETKQEISSFEIKNIFKDFDLNSFTYELYSFSYISWLTVLTIVYLYNCWFIVIRSFFPLQTKENVHMFILVDLVCDLVYLLDILWFKSRLRYFENGLLIKEAHLTRKKYFQKSEFTIDCLSLLPLDVFYLFVGIKPLLRLPRFLKVKCFHELFHCLDSITKRPYIFRILKTLIYMIFLVHLNATAYYYMSYLADFDPNNQWIYNNQGNAYLHTFYFAIRTATSISGRMPKPNNSNERGMCNKYTFDHLSAVMINF